MVRFRNARKSNDGVNIDMTPLIDIIFNLLIFFLITAAITVKGIDLDLPEAATAEKVPSKSWEIIIDENEKIIFNDARIDETKLRRIFEAERIKPESERVSSIILKANRKTPFGTFVRIMDSARVYGFYDLIIATDPEKR
ncbi:MAG TPA: biopolymer transporter ExbD [Spirochaetota bacterium]|nr:biopolymer transporter ExbD [Spirochaetota bacterium]HPJ34378.1 biopolymer transporter ExbD [Spirochaetota bacterium]